MNDHRHDSSTRKLNVKIFPSSRVRRTNGPNEANRASATYLSTYANMTPIRARLNPLMWNTLGLPTVMPGRAKGRMMARASSPHSIRRDVTARTPVAMANTRRCIGEGIRASVSRSSAMKP